MTVELRGQGRFEIVRGCSMTTASAYSVIDGSELDARGWRSLEYDITSLSAAANWQVFGDSASDFTSEVIVQAACAVALNGTDSYSVTTATYSYYRVKAVSAASANPANVSLYALMTG